MKIYYARTDRGCGLRAAESLNDARAQFYNECGFNNVIEVHEATEEDIQWIKGMGGYVPVLEKLNKKGE